MQESLYQNEASYNIRYSDSQKHQIHTSFYKYNLVARTVEVKSANTLGSVGVPWGQITPASSPWKQSWKRTPMWVQSSRCVSFPLQPTSSKKIGPTPGTKISIIVHRIECYCVCRLHNKFEVTSEQGHLLLNKYKDISNRLSWYIVHACGSLTFWGETKLSADNTRISKIPKVITHCPPLSLEAHLHSTFKIAPSSHQPNISVVTSSNCRRRGGIH